MNKNQFFNKLPEEIQDSIATELRSSYYYNGYSKQELYTALRKVNPFIIYDGDEYFVWAGHQQIFDEYILKTIP